MIKLIFFKVIQICVILSIVIYLFELYLINFVFPATGIKVNNFIINDIKDVDIIIANFLDEVVKLNVANEFTFSVKLKEMGVKVNKQYLIDKISKFGNSYNPLIDFQNRYLAYQGRINYELPVIFNENKINTLLLNIKKQVDREAKPAKIDLDKKEVVKDIIGLELDLETSLKNIKKCIKHNKNEVELKVNTTRAYPTIEHYKELDISTVLAYYETSFDPNNKNRVNNIRLIARKLNGLILYPDEVFSFNERVGRRTELMGFKPAPVVIRGELTPGIGGGACQVASTLHAAALFAGLKILDRQPHSISPRYIKLGLDAAVVYPYLDLSFKNEFNFPIVLHFKLKSNKLKCEILGKRKVKNIKYWYKILNIYPPKEKIIKDNKLPKGKKIVKEKGYKGYKIKKFKLIEEDGRKELKVSYDYYQPHNRIIIIGTKNSFTQ